MTKERRKFEACYKLQIVKMVKEDGIAVSQVCKDMNLHETVVSACFKSIKLSQKCEHTQFCKHEKEATSTSKTLSNRFKRQKMGLCGPLLPPALDGGRPRI